MATYSINRIALPNGDVCTLDDAVENLQIGGRNYIMNLLNHSPTFTNCTAEYDSSTGTYTVTVTRVSSAQQQVAATTVADIAALAGKDMVLSAQELTSTDENAVIRVYLYFYRTSTGTQETAAYLTRNALVKTVTVPEDATYGRIFIRCDQNKNSPVGTVATFRGIKLELGNKATDWTPAPEDVEEEIDELRQELASLTERVKALEDA